VERRRFLTSAPAVLASVGLGAVAARPATAADAADAPLWTKARRGVGLGTQRILWSVPAPYVCLTFDDGPDPEITPMTLEILRRYDVPALFMLVGAFVVQHPAVVEAILADGHLLGNHTWTHDSLLALPPEEVRAQLHDTHDALLRHVDRVDWFRPPRGELSGVALQAAAELGYDVLLWGTEELEPLVPGTLAVWHDGLGHRGVVLPPGNARREERRRRRIGEIEELPAAIEAALERGVRFVSVTDATATARVPS
jgi:peptidoglycan/xylan/chitin deacetylase (PgdA/CDA1 family)